MKNKVPVIINEMMFLVMYIYLEKNTRLNLMKTKKILIRKST